MTETVPLPRETFLTPTTAELLESLPPFMQRSVDVQGTLDALAMELDRLEATRQEVLDNFFPTTGERWLSIFERLLGLTVDPPDKTLEQRRASVIAFFRRRGGIGSGAAWVERMSQILGTGWLYEEHDSSDPSSPDPDVIRILFPFTQELVPPSGVAGALSAGGTIPTGTYLYGVTATNFYGETTVSTVSKTVSGTQKVTVSWGAVAGASGYKVYRSEVGGTELFLLAATSGLSQLDDGSLALDVDQRPPGTNTTESYQSHEAKKLARAITYAHIDLEFGFTQGFLVGISEIGDVI